MPPREERHVRQRVWEVDSGHCGKPTSERIERRAMEVPNDRVTRGLRGTLFPQEIKGAKEVQLPAFGAECGLPLCFR